MPNDGLVVDIYSTDISWHDSEALACQLTEADQDRLARFVRPARRSQFISGRLLIREALRIRHGGEAAVWQLAVNEWGKPCLLGEGAPEISLSHSHKWVACAVADRAIGLDVEYLRQRNFNGIVQFACTPDELRQFAALPEDERCSEFYRIWTFKEAAYKLLGRKPGMFWKHSIYSAAEKSLGHAFFAPRNGFLGVVVTHGACSVSVHPPILRLSVSG